MVWAVSLSTTDLITRSLTPGLKYLAFGVYQISVTLDGPLDQTVLYLQYSSSEASPKAISERTSYLQVRLEFLRYPHLIPALFNVRGFGPPVRITAPSTWTWVGHLVSGLTTTYLTPYSDSLSLWLRFCNLTLHAIVTRRSVLQKVRHHTLTCFDCL